MPESEAAQEPTMEEILASIRRIISEDHGDREQTEAASDEVQDAPEASYEDEQNPEQVATEQFSAEDSPTDPEPGVQEFAEEPVANTEGHERETSNPNEERFASIQSVFGHDSQADSEEAYEGEYAEDGEDNYLEPESFGDEVAAETQETYVSLESTPELHEPEVEAARLEQDLEAVLEDEVAEELLSPATQSRVAGMLGQLDEGSAAEGPSTEQPLEAMVRELLRPMLQQWLDDNLPSIVERMVEREIKRVTRAR